MPTVASVEPITRSGMGSHERPSVTGMSWPPISASSWSGRTAAARSRTPRSRRCTIAAFTHRARPAPASRGISQPPTVGGVEPSRRQSRRAQRRRRSPIHTSQRSSSATAVERMETQSHGFTERRGLPRDADAAQRRPWPSLLHPRASPPARRCTTLPGLLAQARNCEARWANWARLYHVHHCPYDGRGVRHRHRKPMPLPARRAVMVLDAVMADRADSGSRRRRRRSHYAGPPRAPTRRCRSRSSATRHDRPAAHAPHRRRSRRDRRFLYW